jgi:hypothetical protein
MKGTGSTKDLDLKDLNLSQIEYLLHQSTQGIHFMFDNSEIAKILGGPEKHDEFFTTDNMKKVQGLLSGLLDCPGMRDKQMYLEKLKQKDYELLVRAYFHLVENTILAHTKIRH